MRLHESEDLHGMVAPNHQGPWENNRWWWLVEEESPETYLFHGYDQWWQKWSDRSGID